MKKVEIFIENDYVGVQKFGINLKDLTKKSGCMMNFILNNYELTEQSCLKDYDYEKIYFDVVLCNNARIHQINKEYRKIDRPTDVISFAIFSDSEKNERFIFDGEINLGEIIISLDKTLEQSNENSTSFKNELYCLLAHGILHLLGFDHQCEKDLESMLDLQRKMIEDCGL